MTSTNTGYLQVQGIGPHCGNFHTFLPNVDEDDTAQLVKSLSLAFVDLFTSISSQS